MKNPPPLKTECTWITHGSRLKWKDGETVLTVQETTFLTRSKIFCSVVWFSLWQALVFSSQREKRSRGQPDARGLCHINAGTAAALWLWEWCTTECSLTLSLGFPGLLHGLFSLSDLFYFGFLYHPAPKLSFNERVTKNPTLWAYKSHFSANSKQEGLV